MFVDVHAHLTHKVFKRKLDSIVRRAKKAGVGAIICSGVNHPTNDEALQLAQKYDIIQACLGLYPIDLLGKTEPEDESGLTRQIEPIDLEKEFMFIKKNKNNIVGVGEVGLDYKWSTDEKEHKKQRENFLKIIAFVEKLGKPIVIHSRKAEKDCIDLLESSSLKNVLLHCFQGNKKSINRGVDLGYYFSVSTNINKLQHFQMMTEMVDISRLLTETDAPWLSPVQGEINEPANVAGSVKIMAKIKNIPFEDMEMQIWKNYERLFLRK